MTTRTIQILGLAYGTEPANISATADGNTVFSGTIPVQGEIRPTFPDSGLLPTQMDFFNFERGSELDNTFNMTYTVNSGTVVFGSVATNYMNIINPAYTAEQIAQLEDPAITREAKNALYVSVANPPLTQADLDTLSDPAVPQEIKNQIVQDHKCGLIINSGSDLIQIIQDPRSNVQIDGILQDPQRDLNGTWWWIVEAGSTLSCDFTIPVSLVQ